MIDVSFHTMAKQMDQVHDKVNNIPSILSILKTILEKQNIIEQELFLIRNNQKATISVTTPPPTVAPPITPPAQTISSPDVQQGSYASKAAKNAINVKTPVVMKANIKNNDTDSKILFIGDSISSNVDLETLQNATGKQFVTAKAYSSQKSTGSNFRKKAPHFPESNFSDVIPWQLSKSSYHALVLQAGSIDISNMNTKHTNAEDIEYFKDETCLSAQNLFKAAENALHVQPTLKKVVIMKHIPRYDPQVSDPLSLKPALSQMFNNLLTELWMSSPLKDRIVIGSHDIECSGAIRESRYRE